MSAQEQEHAEGPRGPRAMARGRAELARLLSHRVDLVVAGLLSIEALWAAEEAVERGEIVEGAAVNGQRTFRPATSANRALWRYEAALELVRDTDPSNLTLAQLVELEDAARGVGGQGKVAQAAAATAVRLIGDEVENLRRRIGAPFLQSPRTPPPPPPF